MPTHAQRFVRAMLAVTGRGGRDRSEHQRLARRSRPGTWQLWRARTTAARGASEGRTRGLSVPRRFAAPAPLERVLGADAPFWLVLLLVLPVLMVGFALTVGVGFTGGLRWTLFDGVPKFGALGIPALWSGVEWLGSMTMPLTIDKDYWWHVTAGNWILDHHRVPATDPFTWTHSGKRWVDHEWLAQVIMALLVRQGGYATVVSFTAVVGISGAWLLLLAARAYGLSWRAACLLGLLWAGVFLRDIITVRPQYWTFTLLAWLLLELALYDTGRRRSLWVLPPLFVVWTNMNLTVLFGLVCLGGFALDRVVHRRLDRHLLIVSVLCAASLLVNPAGYGLITWVANYREQGETLRQHVFEWMGPNFADASHHPFGLGLVVAPVAVWQVLRLRLWPALPLLVVLYQSFQSLRFIPIYVMLAIFFTGWLVWQYGRRPDEVAAAGSESTRVRADHRATPLVTSPVATRLLVPRHWWVPIPPLVALAVALTVAIRSDASQFRHDPQIRGEPADAATILLRDHPEAKLFNVYDFGGYLIYRLQGSILKVYVDGRSDMFSDAFLRHYFDLIDGNPGWQQAFAHEWITAVLVRPSDGIAPELDNSPDWDLVYQDDYSALFVRFFQ